MPTIRTPGSGMPSTPGQPGTGALFVVRTIDTHRTQVVKVAPGDEPTTLRWLELRAPEADGSQRVIRGQEIGRQLPAPQAVRPATRIATAIGYLATALTRRKDPLPAVDLTTLGMPGSLLVARRLPGAPRELPAASGAPTGVIALVPSPGHMLAPTAYVTLPESVRVDEDLDLLASPAAEPTLPWEQEPDGPPEGPLAGAVPTVRRGPERRNGDRPAEDHGGDRSAPARRAAPARAGSGASSLRRRPPTRSRVIVALLAAGLCAAALVALVGFERSSDRRPAASAAPGALPATVEPTTEPTAGEPATTASPPGRARTGGSPAEPPSSGSATAVPDSTQSAARHAPDTTDPTAAAPRSPTLALPPRTAAEQDGGASPPESSRRVDPGPDPDPGSTPTTLAAQEPAAAKGGGWSPSDLLEDPEYVEPGFWRYRVQGTCADGACGLQARVSPALDAAVARVMVDGDRVDITCQALGGQVRNGKASSTVWIQLADGSWIPDLYVTTPGTDGFRECGGNPGRYGWEG
jgi:hypothetical protein